MVRTLRAFLNRPVAWGAVLLSYAGIIAVVAYAASVGADSRAGTDRALRAVQSESVRADRQLAAEAHRREEDLCGVIISVHRNAIFRANTEKHRVEQIKAYLRDTEREEDRAGDTDSSALRDRVKSTLPLAKADARQARANVRATKPPPTCKPYTGKK